ncbi:ATP-binding protein [Agaribacter marinus]|uniref:Sensory/regulatory protein RpfC n=1 Tax=Agaribacter marinus TaxID=1431249 RepID=A0AA37T4R6_9ALTE|nr:ATP-binding protein [Agaribacter marinus]GLR71350.1 hypothetical protein GCM10007852_22580 [Agaribacter marinus]
MRYLFEIFFAVSLLISISIAAQAKSENILIIYHLGNDDTVYQSFESNLIEQLNAKLDDPAIFVEHLDLKRFGSSEYTNAMRRLILEKYTDINLDVILFNTAQAASVFDFDHLVLANSHKFILERLFSSTEPSSPLIHNIPLYPRYDVLVESAGELTKRSKIFVLTAVNTTQQEKNILAQLGNTKVDVEFLPFINTAQTINLLSRLDQSTPLIIPPTFAEGVNSVNNPTQTLKRISRIANQPIFVPYDSLIVDNVVGGYVLSSAASAAFISDQIRLVTNGYLPETNSANIHNYVFNFRALNLQRLPINKLPEGHIILDKPASIFDLFLQELLYIVFVLSILSGVVIFMLYSNRLLRVKQEQLASSQASLKRFNERMDVATNATRIGIWEYDLQTSGLYWDAAMHVHHGIEENRFNNKLSNWLDLLNVQDKVQLEALVNECVQTGASWSLRYTVSIKGSTTYLTCNVTSVKDANNNVIRLVGTVLDVTESELHQQRLQEQRFKAEQATKAKSEFLANMSHEIRTPMNGVIGAADLLAGTSLSEKQSQYANMIKSSAGGLLHILNDILDLSKIESGKLHIETSPFDLKMLVQQTMSTFTLEIARKKLKFKLHHPNYIPDVVKSDALRIKQVLFNLIGNAIKFTEKGCIYLALVYDASNADSDQGTLKFTVTDTGIGISSDDHERIFSSFEQVNFNKQFIAQGTGLGLSISKKLAQLMGGDLSVKSIVDKGSAFTLSVPVTVIDKIHLSANLVTKVDKPDLKNKNILVVDDNEINQTIVGEMLLDCGADVQYANNGAEAVDMHKADRPYIILMDLLMPIMDGIEATRVIREYEVAHKIPRTTIVALTAHALKGYEDNCREAGMDDYLTKPVNRHELYAVCRP